MHPPPHHPARLVGNMAALVLLVLAGGYLLDRVADWLGWKSRAFCAAVAFLAPPAFALGVVLCTVGVIVWAISRFKSDTGVGLVIGGALLAVVLTVMPRYFGVSCLP